MDRREFLTWMGVGGIATYLPVALVACSPKEPKTESPSHPVNSAGFKSVGKVADLDKNGQILDKEFPGGAVLVVRNQDSQGAIAAVNPSCPHAGCIVAWKAEQKEFVCPCHDSKFAIDGKVVQGPAKKPLPIYEAKLEGDSILVKGSKI
ncbi:MAG TPA: cytochrome B6 [Cyanobacteria bacterium UBA11149]|nr:cytochrome B6 [Cyanobacteria bacterium UBA11367]HBE60702.1 cytochrome B6 [Cyanobacteria bacterium UBA11366]HBK66448.1 cytochrome B6 [Cyanobacteria bacterium UBA11166]HBR74500.1 cytochrome B6 [Cyanobacteria bacterium UBA11159]HBS68298.1 cytochrome B6 [Cyanobacteria bacterium UBA11153]HBW91361.1 cytochrome B6 [Cyanobacteria bacterium UBA11149]HCA93604.1 cytochrome B6 [Cyanobacteria bacterium UBA9226]